MVEAHEQPDSDDAFLAAYDAALYPHPSVAVDVALVTLRDRRLEVLLVRRDEPPRSGAWSLPGGFVRAEESLESAARRVLRAKAGIEGVFVEQLYTFGEPDRDPRTRVISVAYYALVDPRRLERALEGAEGRVLAEISVPWEGEAGGPVDAVADGDRLDLAFDHARILGVVVQRLRGKLDYAPIGFELLPETFTLRRLRAVHEVVLGRRLNKDSFRRRMLASGRLVATGEREADVVHRPAELYRLQGARP